MKKVNTQSETIFLIQIICNVLIKNIVTCVLTVSLPFHNVPLNRLKRSFFVSQSETVAFHFVKQKHTCKSITYKKSETILKRFFKA